MVFALYDRTSVGSFSFIGSCEDEEARIRAVSFGRWLLVFHFPGIVT